MLTCTKCGNEIKRGEEYTSLLRQTEKVGRFGAITVKDTESWDAYHKPCAPTEAGSHER